MKYLWTSIKYNTDMLFFALLCGMAVGGFVGAVWGAFYLVYGFFKWWTKISYGDLP